MGKKEKRKKSAKTLSTGEILRSIETRKRKRKYYFLTALVLIVLVIVIIAATRNMPQTPQTPVEQKGSLVVHVADNATGNLIQGATITISGPYTTSAVATDGVYLFQSILIGTYSVAANATGYNQGSETATVTSGQTSHTTVRLTSG